MAKSDPGNKDPYKQQSVILVPSNTKGITIKRMLSVYGYDDAPHGHGQLVFDNVRVPASNMVLGPGRGFEIIQGRLGPGRIHHAMRAIGAVSITSPLKVQMLMRCRPRKLLSGCSCASTTPRKLPLVNN